MTTSAKSAAPAEELIESVRERYGKIAEGQETGCCGPKGASACCGGDGALSLQVGYRPQDLGRVPEESDLGPGCGAPLDFLDLQEGETVLDLGLRPRARLLPRRGQGRAGRAA